MTGPGPRIGLFVTCLVDFHRPSVGLAAIKLLEKAGCTVVVPPLQTCCGQPAFNSGDRAGAASIARRLVREFEGFEYVVAPSGSCAGMIRRHVPDLLADDSEFGPRAREVARRTYELTQFLVDVLAWDAIDAQWRGSITYHDSCSSLRDMGVREQPRRLLSKVAGLELKELRDADSCCGFGGTFCVKFPDISQRMASEKTADIAATGAEMVLAGDLGCLLNIAGRIWREGGKARARHIAEVLAGMTDQPSIGE